MFAVGSCCIFWTLAFKMSHLVNTGAAIVAGVVSAFIYVQFTQKSFIPFLTDTVEIFSLIHAPKQKARLLVNYLSNQEL